MDRVEDKFLIWNIFSDVLNANTVSYIKTHLKWADDNTSL